MSCPSDASVVSCCQCDGSNANKVVRSDLGAFAAPEAQRLTKVPPWYEVLLRC